jgi:hypothetical protein
MANINLLDDSELPRWALASPSFPICLIVEGKPVVVTFTADELRERFESTIRESTANATSDDGEMECYETVHDILTKVVGPDCLERLEAERETGKSDTPLNDLKDWLICEWYYQTG